MTLADHDCLPCRGGVPALEPERAQALLSQLEGGWRLNAAGHLERRFEFTDFARSLAFANRVGAIAEREKHHPDLLVAWGRCVVEIWTHKIDGLTESDFFFAAKAERAFGESASG